MAARKAHKHIHNLGTYAHPPKAKAAEPKSKAKPNPRAPRTHLDTPSKPDTAKVVRGAQAKKKSDTIGPNKTASKDLKRVGPNGSFPVGDKTHDRLAIGGAKTSKRAGNITAAEAARITRAARADERKKGK